MVLSLISNLGVLYNLSCRPNLLGWYKHGYSLDVVNITCMFVALVVYYPCYVPYAIHKIYHMLFRESPVH